MKVHWHKHVPDGLLDDYAEQLKQGARSRQSHNEVGMFFLIRKFRSETGKGQSIKSHWKEKNKQRRFFNECHPSACCKVVYISGVQFRLSTYTVMRFNTFKHTRRRI